MAVYVKDPSNNTGILTQNEVHLYGSSRLGVNNVNRRADDMTPVPDNQTTAIIRGNKFFELCNHLGNVLATITDKKVGIELGTTGTVDYFEPDVATANDYYPFGMAMPGRKYTDPSSTYRYGFNGAEKDNEIKGEGNSLDFGARMYDSRLGRWLSLDPLMHKYAGVSAYNFCLNNPNIYVDKDGRDAILIVFPDYKIDPEIKVGKWKAPKVGGLGHAGVLLIDNKTGVTKYYEYGRYPTKDGTKGRVRSVAVSNVVIGEDGKPTQESLNKVLGQISANSGQGGRIDGAYIVSDQFKAMNDYAQEKLKESNPGNKEYNKDRDPYTLTGNNCGTFASDVICKDPTVDNPSIINPSPSNIVDEYQEEGNAKVTFTPANPKDPKSKATTTVGKGDESDAKKTPKKN